MTTEEFNPVFRELALKFQSAKIPKGTFEAYASALAELHVNQVIDAARQLGHESKFFPNASEWYQLAKSIPPPLGARHPEGGTAHDADNWTFHECPTDRCGREFQHAPHSYVRRRKLLSAR